jgi:two-component system, cell cycle response regulator
LQDVTARCRANIRESDVLACVGGEEFAILLPETTQSAAAQFAERLRAQIGRNALIIFGEKVRVTVSIGVAGCAPSAAGTRDLLRRADHALYDAKNTGRNKVAVALEPEPKLIAAAE